MPHVLTATDYHQQGYQIVAKPMWQIPVQMVQTIKANCSGAFLDGLKAKYLSIFNPCAKSQMVIAYE